MPDKPKPMDAAQQKQLVESYIDAYNRLDVAGMLQPLHQEVVFRNISNGEVDLTLTGKGSFRQQAEQTLQYFSQREQRVTDWHISVDKVEVQLDYSAVAALDFPNGLKAGDLLQLQGKSVFEFKDGLIASITDIS
ncbi:nuclear transport factor 2 family protein [Hymenobacter metallicola]|uniref:Nuclear transport factor 2 family protein n=1 Tax=Hymenobacter metallicola TaxID=2563114 RepID=A0A4Z0QF95_9BACT|nr:nuclear transport factor 2 family protein [Hymenobacter metallicola]TGE27382.1 nuclear transport factor 2 family protein [Hymenobacter metallicola]